MSERFYEIAYSDHKRRGRSAPIAIWGIRCPFCESVTEAYVWSLAGSGKRCNNCSAVHRYHPQISTRADS